MKRIFILIAAACFGLSVLPACDGGGDAKKPADSKEEKDGDKKDKKEAKDEGKKDKKKEKKKDGEDDGDGW